MINTHHYDGKWLDRLEKLRTKISSNITFEQTCDEILIKHPDTENIIRMLSKDKNQNYDVINKVNIEELLPLAWTAFRNTELENLLIEQIIDIKNGSCSQGRTTRIFQVLEILID